MKDQFSHNLFRWLYQTKTFASVYEQVVFSSIYDWMSKSRIYVIPSFVRENQY